MALGLGLGLGVGRGKSRAKTTPETGVGFMSTRCMAFSSGTNGSAGNEAITSTRFEVPYGLKRGWKIPYHGGSSGGIDVMACVAIIEEPAKPSRKVRITFGGSPTITVPNNQMLESDAVPGNVLPGSIVRIATYYKATNAGALPFVRWADFNAGNDRGVAGVIGTLDEQIIWDDEIPNANAPGLYSGVNRLHRTYRPMGIVGQRHPANTGTEIVVAFIGDSITDLLNDYGAGGTVSLAARGFGGRAFGHNVPSICYGVPGAGGDSFVAQANSTVFKYIFGSAIDLRKVTHAVDQFGINTLRQQSSDGDDSDRTWARRVAAAAKCSELGIPYAQVTLTPMTISQLMGYAGHGDATAQFAYFKSQRATFNDRVRSDSLTIDGCIGWVDHAKGVETDYLTNGNTWHSPSNNDGIHPSETGHANMAAQYDLALFTANPNPLPLL